SRITDRREFFRDAAWLATGAAGALAVGPAFAREPIARAGEPRIKLACCAYTYRKYLSGKDATMTLDDFIEKCAELGLDGVELTSYYFPKPVTPEYLSHLKRKAFLLGMDISGTALGNNYCKPPGPERDGQIASTKQWLTYAGAMGAPCMRVFAGKAPDGVSDQEARKWVVECLEECSATAAEHGVILALENHGGVTATADGVLEMITAVDSEWCGLNLDTGNFRTEDPYADIAKVAPYAVTTHVKTDVRPRGGGAGPADFKRIVEILRGVGYRGYLSLEYEAREDPTTGVPKAVERMREAVS
ncbi:MAG: sugar phosphate isomerase/epimerase family protein, partial [Armatimonadota bacterium]